MKSTLLILIALISFVSFSPKAGAADKKEPVSEFYTLQIFIKYEEFDSGDTYGARWIDVPDVIGAEREVPILISGANYYSQFLPQQEIDVEEKALVNYLYLRLVKKSIFLDGSVCVEVVYRP